MRNSSLTVAVKTPSIQQGLDVLDYLGPLSYPGFTAYFVSKTAYISSDAMWTVQELTTIIQGPIRRRENQSRRNARRLRCRWRRRVSRLPNRQTQRLSGDRHCRLAREVRLARKRTRRGQGAELQRLGLLRAVQGGLCGKRVWCQCGRLGCVL